MNRNAQQPIALPIARSFHVRLWRKWPKRGIFAERDRKSTRLNSSHSQISYAVFCVKKKLNSVLRVLLALAVELVIVSLFLPLYKKRTQSQSDIDNLQNQVHDQTMLLARQPRQVHLL